LKFTTKAKKKRDLVGSLFCSDQRPKLSAATYLLLYFFKHLEYGLVRTLKQALEVLRQAAALKGITTGT
jgi:hypothetical protein